MELFKTGLKLVAVSALAAALVTAPAFAQTKSKDKTDEDLAELAATVLASARHLCDRVAANDESVLDTLEEFGWEPEVDSFGEIPFYHEIDGSRDYEGVGRADLWGFVELYPTHIIGYCTFEIISPELDIPVEDLSFIPELTGELEEAEDGVYASFSNADAPHHVFVQARRTIDSFFYQVTDIIERE